MPYREGMEMGRVDRRLPKFDTNNLTEDEQRLIGNLSQDAKETLLRLHIPSIRRHKSCIIGFRSDDLLSLCDFVQKGALQVGQRESGSAAMAKNGNHLYLSANPESSLLQQLRPELLSNDAPKTISESIARNRSMYGNMAIRQAICRNILPSIPNLDRFAHDVAAQTDDDFYNLATADGKATFMEEIIGALSGMNKEYLSILAKHTGFSTQDLTATIQNFQQRNGILLAIDERAAKELGLGTMEQTEGREGEVVILSPDGTMPLDYVVGFETLSDFEDGIMERLEDEAGE